MRYWIFVRSIRLRVIDYARLRCQFRGIYP